MQVSKQTPQTAFMPVLTKGIKSLHTPQRAFVPILNACQIASTPSAGSTKHSHGTAQEYMFMHPYIPLLLCNWSAGAYRPGS